MTKGQDDQVVTVSLADLDTDGSVGLGTFQGAGSGLLDGADLSDLGVVIVPGSVAGVLVYENIWAAPFARALRHAGAQLVANGRIPVQAILAALDAAEVKDAPSTSAPAAAAAIPTTI